jgi:RNA polymerase sigma-70 factor (ECF subfamily)
MTPLLAQRLRADRSFERIYRRYVADVYHYALAVSRNASDAEDITQTTFLNAYRAFQRGEHPRAPKNWLLAIAHNVLRQRFRQSARRPDEVELDDAAGAAVPDDDGYTAEDIRRALGQLAFNQRAALVMRELEGRSYAEIAEILGLSDGAVETLIFRARRALREQLEGTLTCQEAELAVSRQLDGRLSRAEKATLRAHIRSCTECATFARSQRAQRAALKGLAAAPLPSSLLSLFGGGGAAVGGAVATKAAAVTAVGLLVAGGTIETTRQLRMHDRPATVSAKPSAQSPVAAPALVDAALAQPAPTAGTDVGRRASPKAAGKGDSVKAGPKRGGGEVAAAPPTYAGGPPAHARGNGRASGRSAAPGRVKPKPARGRRHAKKRSAPTKPRSQAAQVRPSTPPGQAKDNGQGAPEGKGGVRKDEPPAENGTITVSVPGTGITVSTPRLPKPKKR